MDYQFELPIKVRDYETDSQGIVNNANYLHYLEITRHDFCEQAGTSFRAMQEQGLDPVVRKIEIEYISSLTLGDSMISKLRMHREGARFIFRQDIFNASTGAMVVRAVVTTVCLENGRLSRGDILAEAFAQYL
ncbi:thioesterase family protein [Duncaniella freteri]|jgi:acyl-CoA thioester hydrolase|uniref:Acyl-CoA thioesterase n=2 Tax=Duncaniella TaxID=2518495 RepID=A0A4Z0V902_9BACT|nr:acyl-CoA thioesterase [Duncaniella freteri]MDE7026583.1 acyl-CoA thioesterase [Duncaniella freteri]NBJ08937.1 acyl-CoA thioesterase [Alistipes sp. Z76]NCE70959.1 acyl-CoA thioesterase [Muribaculaceae bacterium M3]TGG39882.1 acyl-CoA thioesterase [Duncaniella freteri]